MSDIAAQHRTRFPGLPVCAILAIERQESHRTPNQKVGALWGNLALYGQKSHMGEVAAMQHIR